MGLAKPGNIEAAGEFSAQAELLDRMLDELYDAAASAAAGGGSAITTGAEGAEPSGPTAGDLYLPNNSFYIERFSGSLWAPWGPIFPLTKPIDDQFSWVNQGASTVSTTRGGILLSAPAGAGDNIRIRAKTAPATPYVITALINPVSGKQTGAASTYGLGFRQSSDGRLHLLLMHQSELGELLSCKFTNPTTFSAAFAQSGQANAVAGFGPLATVNNVRINFPLRWLRIADDGVNRIVSYSPDGIEWVDFNSVARTNFLTADQVCFFVNANDAAVATSARLLSWKEA